MRPRRKRRGRMSPGRTLNNYALDDFKGIVFTGVTAAEARRLYLFARRPDAPSHQIADAAEVVEENKEARDQDECQDRGEGYSRGYRDGHGDEELRLHIRLEDERREAPGQPPR